MIFVLDLKYLFLIAMLFSSIRIFMLLSFNYTKEFSMLFAPLSVSISPSIKRPSIQSFERFLGEVVKGPTYLSNISESLNDYTLQIDIPGVAKNDLLIKIEDQIVRIDTQSEAPRKYNISFELPVAIDPSSSQAKLENGVLHLTLTKKQALSNAAMLQIQ
jgi:HSP20 family protein